MGLGPESLAVHIITLRQHSGFHLFSELACMRGSSHVLMLRGDFVGCALRGDIVVPHIINWRNHRYTTSLLPPPISMTLTFDVPHILSSFGTTSSSSSDAILWNCTPFHRLPLVLFLYNLSKHPSYGRSLS
ncbi:hypothetical protein B0H17DRAFT_595768 [Mycena rosella]|uniref:Uncharacterized protein n=1 Tax=Mycena rosella TaxID=1033263 RepID=A0AAD7DFI4_MYCRO|nr:hypothetical protein B0H17DRAFT_595768 [Mycena rosella]